MIRKQVKCFILRVPSWLFCLQLLLQFFRDQCLIYSSLTQCGFARKVYSNVFAHPVLFPSHPLIEFSDFGAVPGSSRADESHGFTRTCVFTSLRRSTSVLVVPSGAKAAPSFSNPAAQLSFHYPAVLPPNHRLHRS